MAQTLTGKNEKPGKKSGDQTQPVSENKTLKSEKEGVQHPQHSGKAKVRRRKGTEHGLEICVKALKARKKQQ